MTSDRWTIAVDLHTSGYVKACNEIGHMIRALRNLSLIFPRDHHNFNYKLKTIVYNELDEAETDLKFVVEKVKTIEDLISSENFDSGTPRSRRDAGLVNVVGRGLKFLFGVMSDQDSEAINKKMGRMGASMTDLQHDMDAQFSVINQASLLIKDHDADIKNLLNATKTIVAMVEDGNVKSFQTQIELSHRVDVQAKMASLMRIINRMTARVRNNVEDLIHGLDMASSNKLSARILTPKMLLIILKDIVTQLPGELTMLTPLTLNNMYLYFPVATVHATTYDDGLRVFITLPLKSPNRVFTLYRAVSMPTRSPEETGMAFYLKPDYPYLAVTRDGQQFLPMTYSDVAQCKKTSLMICPVKWAVYKEVGRSCIRALFIGNEELSKKLCTKFVFTGSYTKLERGGQGNQWHYSVYNPIPITVACQNNITSGEAKVSKLTIQEEGRFILPPLCTAYSSTFTLYPHSHSQTAVETQSPVFVVPKVIEMLKDLENDEITPPPASPEWAEVRHLLERPAGRGDLGGLELSLYASRLREIRRASQDKEIKMTDYVYPTVTFILIAVVLFLTGKRAYTYWILRKGRGHTAPPCSPIMERHTSRFLTYHKREHLESPNESTNVCLMEPSPHPEPRERIPLPLNVRNDDSE